jgi:hypothetical protein
MTRILTPAFPPASAEMETPCAAGLMWFRRDLHQDNSALRHALERCREVHCVFARIGFETTNQATLAPSTGVAPKTAAYQLSLDQTVMVAVQ